MKLKNISSKIVNVGSVVMMPGDERDFFKADVDTPAIHALCKREILELIKERSAAAETAEDDPEEGTEEDPVEDNKENPAGREKAPKKANGRKKTAE